MNLARLDGRTYKSQHRRGGSIRPEEAPWLTYEEWEYLFGRAVECGIMAVYAGGDDEPRAHFSNPLALGLLRIWREMHAAKASGRDALAFAQEIDAQINTSLESHRERDERERQAQAQRREAMGHERHGRAVERQRVRAVVAEASGGW